MTNRVRKSASFNQINLRGFFRLQTSDWRILPFLHPVHKKVSYQHNVLRLLTFSLRGSLKGEPPALKALLKDRKRKRKL